MAEEEAQCSIECLLVPLLHPVVTEGLWFETPSATSSCCAVNTHIASKLPPSAPYTFGIGVGYRSALQALTLSSPLAYACVCYLLDMLPLTCV